MNAPIFIPTTSPTLAIEKIAMVSSEPTLEPTLEPTKTPVIFDRYFVGDYKVSAQLQSHAKWLLCDGALYNISDYGELFGVLGYVFTAKDISDKTLFAVPDSRDKVIGIYDGTKHLFGDVIGADWIKHSHYLLNLDLESIDINNMNGSNVTLDHAYAYGYIVYGGNGEEININGVKSSATGYDRPFSSYQPTIFMGNAFIYS
jgi:microcystin-dependent protein